jgi:hypothetical protein
VDPLVLDVDPLVLDVDPLVLDVDPLVLDVDPLVLDVDPLVLDVDPEVPSSSDVEVVSNPEVVSDAIVPPLVPSAVTSASSTVISEDVGMDGDVVSVASVTDPEDVSLPGTSGGTAKHPPESATAQKASISPRPRILRRAYHGPRTRGHGSSTTPAGQTNCH